MNSAFAYSARRRGISLMEVLMSIFIVSVGLFGVAALLPLAHNQAERGITADRVLDILTNLFLTRGVPRHVRSDNGPEFIARAIRRHGEQAGLEMLYIEPGSPWENGYAESFFSRLRDELLNCEEFGNLAEARWFARRRVEEHNHERPHSSLGYHTPAAFAAACAASAPAVEGPARKQPSETYPNRPS